LKLYQLKCNLSESVSARQQRVVCCTSVFPAVVMESLLPLAGFAFVSSITPGPNNVMLSASGVAFGMRRTLPHMFGVALGFLLLLIVCGGGVGALVIRFPALGLALKSVGTLYLLYLAWAMRNALVPQANLASGRPL